MNTNKNQPGGGLIEDCSWRSGRESTPRRFRMVGLPRLSTHKARRPFGYLIGRSPAAPERELGDRWSLLLA